MKNWTCKNGKEIAIANMETSHIKNVLAMLKRNGFISKNTRTFYLTCRRPQGEMANIAFEEEFTNVLKAPVCLFVDIFEKELKLRSTEKKDLKCQQLQE